MVYLYTLSSIILLFVFVKKNTHIYNKYIVYGIIFLFYILFSFMAYHNHGQFSDSATYFREFIQYTDSSFLDAINANVREPLFFLLQWINAQITDSTFIFSLTIASIVFLILIKSISNIFDKHDRIFVILTLMHLFVLYNYAFNVIRQGIAIALILLSISYLINNKNKKGLLIIWLAPLFHWTSIIFVLAVIFVKYINLINKFKYLISFWLISVGAYLSGIQETLLNPITSVAFSEEVESYTSDSALERYDGVNRIDFLIFNTVWLVIGVFYKKAFNNLPKAYGTILNIYVLFNIIYFLFGFIAFSDRLAAYSWFLVPFILWYPVLNANFKYKKIIMAITIIISILLGIFFGISGYYEDLQLIY